ncbi:alpha/beta fold hydrolase [Methylovorus glucosotrophus]|uniref:Alpha/beta hydrolase fold protein n=1 Tax=Methylovorus glucosotrophus (strain SIP3-4) TaxID=582744 RepID=C6XBB8_METGS|nr:alpha/beta hydrolase [Methylovorus glucosotrophus]ACT51888.1 alpha/beta hydrolase fold protein [Methylovorus glucosotrophus SIP3-4]
MLRYLRIAKLTIALGLVATATAIPLSLQAAPTVSSQGSAATKAVSYHTVDIDGVKVFYREAGPANAPVVLLLHGFPSSSHMFRNLIPQLAERYHVIAPDYPGYGQSDQPAMDKFTYSFDNLAMVIDKLTIRLGLGKFAIYVQDYGAPVGYRIASAHPEKISAIVVQNGNAYEEGIDNQFWVPVKDYWKNKSEANAAKLRPILELAATKWQYTEGFRNPAANVSPDAWMMDQAYMDRPGNKDIQLELFYSYGTNPPHYAEWQAYFRRYQPPMLIVWGKNDKIFPAAGATPYLRDLPNAELHLLDTGHFALEEDGDEIARLMGNFLDRNVQP